MGYVSSAGVDYVHTRVQHQEVGKRESYHLYAAVLDLKSRLCGGNGLGWLDAVRQFSSSASEVFWFNSKNFFRKSRTNKIAEWCRQKRCFSSATLHSDAISDLPKARNYYIVWWLYRHPSGDWRTDCCYVPTVWQGVERGKSVSALRSADGSCQDSAFERWRTWPTAQKTVQRQISAA